MPENTIEVGLILRDQATQGLERFAAATQDVTVQATAMGGQVRQAVQDAGAGLEDASRDAVGFSRQVSVAGNSARFLAVTVASELNPALGQGAARLTSLASVAAFSGSAMTAFATVGIGGLIIGLGFLISKLRAARKEAGDLTKAIAEGNVPALQKSVDVLDKQIASLKDQIDAAKRGSDSLRDLATALSGVESAGTPVAVLNKQLFDLEKKRRDLLDQLVLETPTLTLAEHTRLLLAEDTLDIDRRLARTEFDRAERIRVLTEAQAELAEVSKKVSDETLAFDLAVYNELLAFMELQLKATRKAQDEEIRGAARTERQVRQDFFRRQQAELQSLRQALEGQQQLLLEHLDRLAKHGRDAGEQFSAGVQAGLMRAQEQMGTFGQSVRGIIEGTAQAWARTLDDVFFNVITGQTKKLQDTFKQFAEALLREITGAAARAATANLLRGVRAF